MTAFMSTLQAVHGTAPDPPCGEFNIEAVAEDGTRRRVALAFTTRADTGLRPAMEGSPISVDEHLTLT